MNTNHDLESIFSQAVELVDPDRRADFLDSVCTGEPALRNRVRALLDANKRAESFMEEPAGSLDLADMLSEPDSIGEQPGDRVGRYKLLQKIGEGGMGTVFMAEQEAPVHRKVALKIVKPGLDTKEVIARFESERQALALMSHSHIARVLDAGATVQGRPYFVMELVKGIPVTDYCNEARLSTRERLELFVPICQAIQHAHQKGVIHRDIKPRNVLVTLIDGKPVPKVIDFGIAKAIDHRLTDKTLFTRFGEFIGTPAYMSPEQAALSGIDVDTRSDVYSLGALLYELLTGIPPFDSEQLKTMEHDEMRRFIREATPVQPSDAVGTSGADRATTIAEARRSTLRDLKSQIHGELDWIVMRTLEKERARRYETASALADDILRYLNDEAVVAKPQTLAYRLRKFVARNRVAVLASGAIATTLLVATGVSGWLAVSATAARRAADDEMRGQREIVEFMTDSLLAQADPLQEPNRDVKLRTVLDRAAAKLDAEAIKRPRVEMSLRTTIGETYRGLGELRPAVLHFKRAHALGMQELGESDRKTISAANNLASAWLGLAKHNLAVPLLKKTLQTAERKLAPEDDLRLTTLKLSASCFQATGELQTATRQFEQILKVRKKHDGETAPATYLAMADLATAYRDLGRRNEALQLLTTASEGMLAHESEWHPETLKTSLRLAGLHLARNEREEAAGVYERTLAAARQTLGPDHVQTLSALHGVALVRINDGDFDEAVSLLEQVLNGQTQKLGDDHPTTLDTMLNLAQLHARLGQLEKAESLLLTELSRRRASHGDKPRAIGNSLSGVAFFYLNQAKFVDAIPYYSELTTHLMKQSPNDVNTLAARMMLAVCQHKAGQHEQARGELEALRDICHATRPEHWLLPVVESQLGEVLLKLGERNDAEDALLSGYDGLKLHEPNLPPRWKPMGLRAATRRLAEFYESSNDEALRERGAEFRAELQPPHDRSTERTEQGKTGREQDGNTN